MRLPAIHRSSLSLSIILAILALTGCTQGSPDCFEKDIFCAALVTDTRGLNDFGPNQNAWAGLQQAKANGTLDQIAYIESVDSKDYEKNIAFFVNAGYDVIVTSSIGLQTATLRSADLHPATVFVGINQADEESKTNFIAVTFPEDKMGFLAGALAARLTDTGIVGAACEASGIDAMWRYCEGFRNGATYANETIKVLVEYRDDGSRDKLFIDPDWGAQAAKDLINSGADVLFAAGGETAAGALREAAGEGILVIGAERDQGAALGEAGLSVVTSVLGRISFTVEELMRRVRAGDLADVKAGPVGYLPLEAKVEPGVVETLASLLSGLENDKITTNVTIKRP